MNYKNDEKLVRLVQQGYATGNFKPMFPFMAEDYAHVSFWVLEVLHGILETQEYYTKKGRNMRNSGSLPDVQLVHVLRGPDRVRPHGLFRNGVQVEEAPECLNRDDAGKLAVLCCQIVNGEEEEVRTLMIPTTQDGMLKQLLVTEPGFYDFMCVE